MITLLAIFVALSAPVAHGPYTLECGGYPGAAGITYGAEARVSLDPEVCTQLRQVYRHRHASPFIAAQSVGTLLHEARHVAQYRECREFCSLSYDVEWDANCAAYLNIRKAMRELGYSDRFAKATRAEFAPTVQHGWRSCLGR